MGLTVGMLVAATALAPAQLSYWFELWGVPVGVVTLKRVDGEYEYRSSLVFTRGADRTQVQRGAKLRVDASGKLASGEAPESLWLSVRPAQVGCQRVVEELGGRTGEACLQRRVADVDEGTVLGAKYRARYDGLGALYTLEIGDSRFVRLEGASRSPHPADLFGDGLMAAIGKGALRLVPAVRAPKGSALKAEWTAAAAREVAESVHGRFAEKNPSAADFGEPSDSAGCLGHARAFVTEASAKGRSAAIVQGLLAATDEDRAYPHVWVRVRLATGELHDLDPTSLDDVTAATHLPLSAGAKAEDAGALWLQILRGGHRVERGR